MDKNNGRNMFKNKTQMNVATKIVELFPENSKKNTFKKMFYIEK